ncbi:hypothetical protein [Bifidobacterium longum]|uniref:hypothetical protein n=1 Tax=Bifidobacterium longum TaxID=216816 RepID=UPI0015F33485|nr:hypothetical protein [Bifidobacterium longum]
MLTGKEILLLDLYSFQRWPDVRAAFDRSGSYTPSWKAARRQAVADDGVPTGGTRFRPPTGG